VPFFDEQQHPWLVDVAVMSVLLLALTAGQTHDPRKPYTGPEYSNALRAVDVDNIPVKDFAATAGLTATNASVRLLRARVALKKQVARACGVCATHGCIPCSCHQGRQPQ
jgi:hypothetical protein